MHDGRFKRRLNSLFCGEMGILKENIEISSS